MTNHNNNEITFTEEEWNNLGATPVQKTEDISDHEDESSWFQDTADVLYDIKNAPANLTFAALDVVGQGGENIYRKFTGQELITNEDDFFFQLDDLTESRSVVGEFTKSAPRMAAGGALDAVDGVAHLTQDALAWASGQEGTKSTDDYWINFGTLVANENDMDKVGRQITSFVLPFFVGAGALSGVRAVANRGKYGKAMQWLASSSKTASVTRSALGGAAIDLALVNPHEERLADLISDDSVFHHRFVDYLQSDPDDHVMESRFKNVLEGAALGVMAELGFRVLGKAARKCNDLLKKGKKEEASSLMKEAAEEVKEIRNTLTEIKKAKADQKPLVVNLHIKGKKKKKKALSVVIPHGILKNMDDRSLEELTSMIAQKTVNPQKNKDGFFVWSKVFGDMESRVLMKQSNMVQRGRTLEVTGIDRVQAKPFIPQSRSKHLKEALNKDALANTLRNPESLLQGKPTSEPLLNIDKITSEKDVVDTIIAAGDTINQAALPKDMNFKNAYQEAQDFMKSAMDINQSDLQRLLNQMVSDGSKHPSLIMGGNVLLKDTARNLRETAEAIVSANAKEQDITELVRSLSYYLHFNAMLTTAVKTVKKQAGQALSASRFTSRDAIEGLGKTAKHRHQIPIEDAKPIILSNEEGLIHAQKAIEAADDAELLKFAHLSRFHKGTTAAAYAFKSSILSGIGTHAVNIAGSLINIPLTLTNELIGSTVRFDHRQRKVAQRQLLELFLQVKTAGQMAIETLKRNQSMLDTTNKATELNSVNPISAGYWGVTNKSKKGILINGPGHLISVPFRGLATFDELFKQVGYRSRIAAKATIDARYAMQQKNLTRDQKKAFIKKHVQDALDASFVNVTKEDGSVIKNARALLDAKGERGGTDIADSAIEFARETTFSKPLESKFGKDASRFLKNYPLLQFVIPFLTTPLNVMKQTAKNFPFINTLFLIKDIRSANPAIRSRAIGRVVTSAVFGTGVLAMCQHGMITGGYPRDKRLAAHLRRSGWRPYSVYQDGKYHDYRRIEPFGQVVGMLADAHQIYNNMNDPTGDTKQKLDDIVKIATASFAENIKNKTFFLGVKQVIDVANDPTSATASRFFGNILNAMIPGSSLRRSLSQEQEYVYKEANNFLEHAAKDTLFFSDNVPSKIDWLTGNPVMRDPKIGLDFASPYSYSVEKDDVVYGELAKLGHVPDAPAKHFTLNGQRVRLNSHQYARLCELMGTTKIDNMKVYDAFKRYFNSSTYKAFDTLPKSYELLEKSQDQRIKTLTRIRREYLEKAKSILLEEYPELLHAITQK